MKPRNLTDEGIRSSDNLFTYYQILGYITDMKTLPVTALLFSSIEESSYISFTVGTLKCSGQAARTTSDVYYTCNK